MSSKKKNAIGAFMDDVQAERQAALRSWKDTYWSAAEQLAAGDEPEESPADVAEAGERIGRGDDLEADAATLAELAVAEEQAARHDEARARFKAAAAAGQAEAEAAALEQQARALRARSGAAIAEARNELSAIAQAAERARRLRHELARRGHPASLAATEAEHRHMTVESMEAELRTLGAELRDAEASAKGLAVNGRAVQRAVELRAQQAALQTRLQEVQQ